MYNYITKSAKIQIKVMKNRGFSLLLKKETALLRAKREAPPEKPD